MTGRNRTGADLWQWKPMKGLKRHWELYRRGEAVAGLRFENAFGSLATGRWGEQAWTLKRAGFLHPYVTVRRAGSERELGRARLSWSGSAEIEIGKVSYRLVGGTWRSERTWLDRKGATLAVIRPKSSARLSGSVEIPPGVEEHVDLPLLLVLGWYLQVLADEEHAAMMASVAG